MGLSTAPPAVGLFVMGGTPFDARHRYSVAVGAMTLPHRYGESGQNISLKPFPVRVSPSETGMALVPTIPGHF
jgi:hypothetical protein